MHNKPTNRWLDVQITIVTLVMTLSLGLWNLFASKSQPSPEKVDTQTPVTANPSQVQQATIYFSNNAPRRHKSSVLHPPREPVHLKNISR